MKKNFRTTGKYAILIGGSMGSPRAIETILPKFPTGLSAGILLVVHMPVGFTDTFAKRLNKKCALQVKEASDKDTFQNGVALFAPGGHNLYLDKYGRIRIVKPDQEMKFIPSINVAFSTAADFFKEKTIGIILTGMGRDGVEGLKKIKKYNGYTIAQDEKSSLIFGMPKAAIDSKCIDRILPLEAIPHHVMKRLNTSL